MYLYVSQYVSQYLNVVHRTLCYVFACIFHGMVHLNMPSNHLELIMPYSLRNVVYCLQNSGGFSYVHKVSESFCVYRAINASGWYMSFEPSFFNLIF